MATKRVNWRRIDSKLLQAAMMPKGETVKALQAISKAYGASVASLNRRLQHLGAYRMEARWGWKALERWERHHRTIAKLCVQQTRFIQQIFYQRRYLAEEIRKFMARTYSDQQVARFLYVTPNWIAFVADVLHKLNREPNGRFKGTELERFMKEDWYLLKGRRLIQRNDRLLKRKRAEAAQNVPMTKIAKILLSRRTDPPARH